MVNVECRLHTAVFKFAIKIVLPIYPRYTVACKVIDTSGYPLTLPDKSGLNNSAHCCNTAQRLLGQVNTNEKREVLQMRKKQELKYHSAKWHGVPGYVSNIIDLGSLYIFNTFL